MKRILISMIAVFASVLWLLPSTARADQPLVIKPLAEKKVPKKRLGFGEGCETPHNSARWNDVTSRPKHARWH